MEVKGFKLHHVKKGDAYAIDNNGKDCDENAYFVTGGFKDCGSHGFNYSTFYPSLLLLVTGVLVPFLNLAAEPISFIEPERAVESIVMITSYIKSGSLICKPIFFNRGQDFFKFGVFMDKDSIRRRTILSLIIKL